MATARYWRLVAFDVENGSDLRLAEIELRGAGTRVDGPATISSSVAPASGALADLKNSLTTDDVRFAAAAIAAPAFEIAWDFGADTLVDEFLLTLPGGAPNVNYCELQYLSAGVWTLECRWFGRFTNATPRLPDMGSDASYDNVLLLLSQDPANLAWLDLSKRRLTSTSSGSGSPYIRATPTSYPIWGSTQLSMEASSSATTSHVFSYSGTLDGDFTVEAWIFAWNYSSTNRTQIVSFGPTSSSWGLTTYSTGVGTRGVQVRNAAGTEVIAADNVFSQLNWTFVQWVREAGVHKLFVNGTLRGTFNDNSTITISEFRLGNLTSPGSASGIDWNSLRVTKGVVRPSAVPSAPFPEPLLPALLAKSQGAAVRISEYAPPAQTQVIAAPRAAALDLAFGGTYRIVGTVRRQADPVNLPLRRRVRLLNEKGTATVRETWSDATTGEFSFENVAAGLYVVMTYDHLNQYRALAADQVWSVPM